MPMDSSFKSYRDFEPLLDCLHHPESHLLLVHLLGFTRNNLEVRVTSTGKLRISGERRLTSGKWLRFLNEIDIPEDADTNKISAEFEKGILYVTQPRKTSAVSSNNPPAQPSEPKAESQPPPTASTRGIGRVRRGEWLRRNMVNLALGAAAVFVIVYLNLTNNDHMEQQW
ncbi:inactive protein RESTRICTED TEV MOVEMENT 2-like [Cucurbita moschata]|uniref:Inactive protein RESTRICTED TEV MOVEMENT 2-like n=1 Tax=Cucurbita moschata TaxID=3662 RepID=A0A6J1H8V9_CUCMO|nr:inactive protein RESTRICTED TEV MOVEMENT 2-like [Cucurbita moschata]